MSQVRESALKFVETTFEEFHMECYDCRYLERDRVNERKACRVLQQKASLIDCPAIRSHFALYQRKST